MNFCVIFVSDDRFSFCFFDILLWFDVVCMCGIYIGEWIVYIFEYVMFFEGNMM